MRDPYFFEDAPVLRNALGIKDSALLEKAEADITNIKLFVVDKAIRRSAFNFARLLAIHRHIFCDIYEWAGRPRTISIEKGEKVIGGDTVRYSQPETIERDCTATLEKMNGTDWTALGVAETAEAFGGLVAELWRVHPFREGNTRAVMAFAVQFAEAHGFRMDKTLLKDNAGHVRDALVKASDGKYSENRHISKVFEAAIRRG